VEEILRPHPDIRVIPSFVPIPGAGFLPVNAFVILGQEPVLVDTGLAFESGQFLAQLREIIDPAELRWIFLTHDDADHTGSLQQLMEIAPNARLATNAMSAMRMSTVWPVPMDRVYAINPGESLQAGDRKLTAVRPPLFDNPMSTGLYDETSGTFFSCDAFGAVVPRPVERAEDLQEDELAQGMVVWAASDSPWAHLVDQTKYGAVLDRIGWLEPKLILSSHLPPAGGASTQSFLKVLATVPDAEPFVAPNQVQLEQMLAQMEGQPQP
jgi:hypothetical protein